MNRRRVVLAMLLVLPLLLLFGVGLWMLGTWEQPRLTQEQVREAITSRIQSDAPQAFLVTGRLDIVATTTVENTRTLLPDLLDFSLGTTRSSVRAPGRVAYGFEVSALRPEMIRLVGDSLIEMDVPPLRVYSVEPILSEMEVETEVGWARRPSGSGREVERRAIAILQRALRQQANAHLASSIQPRVHSAEAMHDLLTPVLEALGMESPRFRFNLTSQVDMETTSR